MIPKTYGEHLRSGHTPLRRSLQFDRGVFQGHAVWFQDFSDGAAMNLNNLPIVKAGSCGGFFKTGQAVNVWDESADLSPGNSEPPCTDGNRIQSIGAKDTGTPPEIANAPINKYYCSLPALPIHPTHPRFDHSCLSRESLLPWGEDGR